MNAPDHIGNAISEYCITKKDKIPGIPDVKAAYDKLSAVMICLKPRTGEGVESNVQSERSCRREGNPKRKRRTFD
mgnify:CR=1 FL=1